MRFAEAEQRYRELEDRLLRGELTEDEFLLQVSQLGVVDQAGRRWMISSRTGRWLMYDGRRWTPAEPPADEPDADLTLGAELAPEEPSLASQLSARQERRSSTLRWLGAGLLAAVLIGCLLGLGALGWVFFLRGLGEATPAPSGTSAVALAETYTPRPATPTYTPTSTPTPSRTPTATVTPIPSPTPIPTDTPTPLAPTATPSPTPSPTATPTPTATPSATPTSRPLVTHVVQRGETLSEIAVRYGVSVQALAAANNIANPALIRPGQVLTIPIPGTTPQAPTVTATPTWTPIALATRKATPTATRTATPKPRTTATPVPKATATPRPPSLTGKIAFTIWNPALGEGKYELYVSNIDGSGRNMIGVGFRQPQFRPDGNMLAVAGEGNQNYEHLNIMNPSGGDIREISDFSEDAYPTWSPNGNRIAYSSSAWGDGRILLGRVDDLLGKGWSWVPYGNTECQGEYPFWLSDGRLVYRGCSFWTGGGNCGLYLVDVGGGNPERLTTDSSDWAPAAYGNHIAFMSARDGNWEVYSINTDGSGLKRLTNNGAEDGLPSWSPDGKSIAFVSRRDGAWAIWVMKADGTNQRKLFDLGGGYGSGRNDWTTERISWAP